MSFDFSQFHAKSQKAIEHLKQEMGTLRTGRASVDLLDPVMVEAYGTRMRLVEVASVTAPDPTLLVISPWDKSLVSAVEKGIAAANLELNPVVDGQIIRIAIPSLTEERRKEMVKLLQRRAEEGKVMLRSVRTDTKKEVEAQEGEDGISEDDIAADLDELEKLHKQYMDQTDSMTKTKEKELLTF